MGPNLGEGPERGGTRDDVPTKFLSQWLRPKFRLAEPVAQAGILSAGQGVDGPLEIG
jgi:hypothetical protein